MMQETKKEYEILGYELYEFPRSMTDTGVYVGRTPLREQAEAAVRNAKKNGVQLFVKAVCSDGIKRFY